MSGESTAIRRPGAPFLFARREPGAPWPPAEWAKQNLFGSIANTVLTLAVLAGLALIVPPLVRWGIANATVSGVTRAACGPDGACWTFIKVHLPLFFFGHYPAEERWRLFAALLVVGGCAVPVLREHTRHRGPWLLA